MKTMSSLVLIVILTVLHFTHRGKHFFLSNLETLISNTRSATRCSFPLRRYHTLKQWPRMSERAAMAMSLALAEQRGISTRCSSKGFATNVPYFTEFKIADPMWEGRAALSRILSVVVHEWYFTLILRLRKETFEPASLLRLSVLTRGHLDRREN